MNQTQSVSENLPNLKNILQEIRLFVGVETIPSSMLFVLSSITSKGKGISIPEILKSVQTNTSEAIVEEPDVKWTIALSCGMLLEQLHEALKNEGFATPGSPSLSMQVAKFTCVDG